MSVPRAPAVALLVIVVLMLTKLALERFVDNAPVMTTCNFKNATGVPCAFCGGTRATISMAGGNMSQAIQWNPLVVFGNFALGFWLILRFGFGLALRWQLPSRARAWVSTGIVLLFTANWVYLVHHLD